MTTGRRSESAEYGDDGYPLGYIRRLDAAVISDWRLKGLTRESDDVSRERLDDSRRKLRELVERFNG